MNEHHCPRPKDYGIAFFSDPEWLNGVVYCTSCRFIFRSYGDLSEDAEALIDSLVYFPLHHARKQNLKLRKRSLL